VPERYALRAGAGGAARVQLMLLCGNCNVLYSRRASAFLLGVCLLIIVIIIIIIII